MKTIKELREANASLELRMQELLDKPTMSAEESAQYAKMEREHKLNVTKIQQLAAEEQIKAAQRQVASESEQSKMLREKILSGTKGEFTFQMPKREAIAGTQMSDIVSVTPKKTVGILDQTPLDNSVYRLAGCPVQYGATGLNSWSYVNNADVKIQDELTPIGDAGKITTTGKTATQQRITAKIILDWQSINNSEIDLEALAVEKINAAYEEAINFAAVSTAKYNNNFYGGFASAGKQTHSYAKEGFKFSDATAMVGKVAAKNYPTQFGAFVMGATDFWALKSTPKDAGSGLMVIGDDNRLAGFPVCVTEAVNRATVKGAAAGANIGFGIFNTLPCLQHGTIRMTIDSTSASAADVDGVIIICNADWSMTRLREDAFVLATKKAE